MISGRTFSLVEISSIERVLWIAVHLQRGGLESLPPRLGEAGTHYWMRVVNAFMASSALYLLLAAFIVPQGEEWTFESAQESAALLVGSSEQEALPAMLRLLAALFEYLMAQSVIARYHAPEERTP